ncbi:alpha-xylosidase 1 [Cryptomeria japonica]|uniref:alpha-xylosidase 1 n=1 Tax=Cryptomeria japonica TaxID=3369 RepID=UPI0025ABA5EC|nr:alpha-xylosidase 1 [Cryptomeria japonica]
MAKMWGYFHILFSTFFSVLFLPLACQAFGSGYTLTSITEAPDGKSFTAQLQLISNNSLYGPDIQHLKLQVRYESNECLRVYITDAEKQRWEIPREVVVRYENHHGANDNTYDPELQFSYTQSPFGFAVTRRSNGEVLFNSSAQGQGNAHLFGNMVFKDQYLEISTGLPSTASLYGLGESTRPGFMLNRNGSQYTLWNQDVLSLNLYLDLYGSHPFYMDVRAGGIAHGVLLLNSNGMDIEYGGNYLTYRVIGGVLDFYFFSGPSPLSVVQQYTGLVGRPAPMPYWSFGFHQCRYGYENILDLKSVVAGYAEAKIPLEVLWTDIDHMDGFKIFTLDPVNFPEKEMREFIREIHANGQKYVLIVDPGININETYKTFQRGIRDDIFVKRAGAPYISQLWPGPVYFPDFLNPKSLSFWENEISEFHNTIPFDGLWLDMNECTNECSGICSLPKDGDCPRKYGQIASECCLICSNANSTIWDDPPYKINSSGIQRPLGNKTIAASAVHYNDILEYNAHNLYGLAEAIVTNKALKSVLNKRPFVLTRSTFVSSGNHAAHWTGDNAATWDDLWYSIPTMLSFGLFGVPMVGADICGFKLDTTEELCNRWIQLGSFYPFARDHSAKGKSRQELYLWKSVTESARKALGLRYRLLPYIYTLSFEAHTEGSPIARPLFFTFPNDTNTLGISTQYLLGKGVLVSPVLKEGARTVDAYFPKGTWYNLFNVSDSITVESGAYVKLQAPLDIINIHVYEGTILPMQEMGMTTREARKSPFSLVVALGSEMEATGELYLDNGDDLEMQIERGRSSYVEFYANIVGEEVRLKSLVQMGEFAIKEGWILQSVTVLGLKLSSASVADDSIPILSFHCDGLDETKTMVENILVEKTANVAPSFSMTLFETDASPHVDDYGGHIFQLVISNLSLPIGKNFELGIKWKK